ncbi:MAG: hypothetical protein HY796_12590 [Elusimicrobia bacterium]|nr:hypothetical protein [Elusimicrobiota bacterium]
MTNVVAKNKQGVEKYRAKIFKAKEECRKELARLPFEEKIEALIRLQKRANYLKKFSRLP